MQVIGNPCRDLQMRESTKWLVAFVHVLHG
jgi:hypothetical protein